MEISSEHNRIQAVMVVIAMVLGSAFLGTGLFSVVRSVEEPGYEAELKGFGSDKDIVIARVNGHAIRLSDLIMARAELPREIEGLPEAVITENLINELIDRRLMAEAAFRQGLTRDGVLKGRFEFEQEKLLRDQYIAGMVETGISERAIKQLYREKYDNDIWRREARVWQILVRDRGEALSVIESLRARESFDVLARAHSVDTYAVMGGDMGYQTGETLLPEVADAVFAMKEGELSAPIRSRFGWHVLWIQDQRLREPPPYITVRNALRRELVEGAVNDTIRDLRAEAQISRSSLPFRSIAQTARAGTPDPEN